MNATKFGSGEQSVLAPRVNPKDPRSPTPVLRTGDSHRRVPGRFADLVQHGPQTGSFTVVSRHVTLLLKLVDRLQHDLDLE